MSSIQCVHYILTKWSEWCVYICAWTSFASRYTRVDQPCRKFRVISNSVWNVHELDRFRGSRRTSLMVERGRNHVVDASSSFTSTLLPVQLCHKSSWPTSRRVPVARLRARTYCRRRQTKARTMRVAGCFCRKLTIPKSRIRSRENPYFLALGEGIQFMLALRNVWNCSALEIAQKANLSTSVAILYICIHLFYIQNLYNIKIQLKVVSKIYICIHNNWDFIWPVNIKIIRLTMYKKKIAWCVYIWILFSIS